jgi:putative oxidoreductase
MQRSPHHAAMNISLINRIARILLAIMLLVFGANKFFHFMEMPAPPEAGGKFLGMLMDAGYVFPTIGVVFIVAGLLLLIGRNALAVFLVAPIAVNILGYHIQYDMAGIGAGVVLSALLLIVAGLNCGQICRVFSGAASQSE